MEQIQSSVHLFKEEVEEDDDQLALAGSLMKRQPRHPKNGLDVAPAKLLIDTASSNVSTLTNEDQGPEPEPEPNDHHHHHDERHALPAQLVEFDVVKEEELPETVTFEQEQVVALVPEEEEPDHGDVDYIAPKKDLTQDLDVIEYHDGELLISQRAQVDDVYDLTAERYKTEDEDTITYVEEFVPEDPKYDVQTVLDKQKSHDLFCPKCRSCITRKVILQRRRIRVPRFRPGGRGGRVTSAPEPSPPGPIVEDEDQTPAVVVPDVPAENQPQDREVFRCLSCFSFFSPTGEGTQLLWFFKKKSEPGNVPAVVTEKPSFPFFQWNKKPPIPKGPDAPATPSENTEEDPISGHKKVSEDMADSSPQKASNNPEKPLIIITDQINTYFQPPLPKIDMPVIKPDVDNAAKEPFEFIGPGVIKIRTAADASTTPVSDTPTDVENPPEALTQPLVGERSPAEVPEVRDFDILKSIVYGGLVESVASLGVVSSAAGGGASTLNTLALALANIISGLFVLVHNLREMKNETPSESQAERDTRYYQNLGRRGKFILHATMAVISFLVFGCVAPITYGFSFRISDNRDYKLIAVAAASLVCILFLALGKARVTSESYFKTAVYYLMMGFVASGISFVAGSLFDKLLEQLDLFSSTSISVGGFLSETSQRGSGSWDFY